jgi:hypothetical protein
MSIDTETDGRHDFDFIAGTWHVHSRRLTNALDPVNWVMENRRVDDAAAGR